MRPYRIRSDKDSEYCFKNHNARTLTVNKQFGMHQVCRTCGARFE